MNVDNMIAIYIMLYIVGMLLHVHLEVHWPFAANGLHLAVSLAHLVMGKANLWD